MRSVKLDAVIQEFEILYDKAKLLENIRRHNLKGIGYEF